MFSAHLEERMLADAPQKLRELHRAAAHWYAEHDHLSDAVRSAFASNDAAFAGELLARASAARKRIGRFRIRNVGYAASQRSVRSLPHAADRSRLYARRTVRA